MDSSGSHCENPISRLIYLSLEPERTLGLFFFLLPFQWRSLNSIDPKKSPKHKRVEPNRSRTAAD